VNDNNIKLVTPEQESSYDWQLRKEAEFWGKMARVRWDGGIPMTMDFTRATRYRVRRAELGWGDYFQDPKADALTPFGRARIRFINKTQSTSGNRALDLGCGAGWLALEEARAGKLVDAVDISAEEQNVAREYQSTLEETIPGSINWVVADLNRFETKIAEYDVVTAWDALHHIRNISGLIEQIDRGLKPGGYFLLSERVWGSENPSVRARIGMYLERFLWTLVPTPSPYTYRRKFREFYGTLSLFFKTKILRKKHTQMPWQIKDDGFCSPFEDACGQEIIDEVTKRFDIERMENYGGFTEEILRSLFLPRFLRMPATLFLGWLDHALVKARILEGKICIVYARKRDDR